MINYQITYLWPEPTGSSVHAAACSPPYICPAPATAVSAWQSPIAPGSRASRDLFYN